MDHGLSFSLFTLNMETVGSIETSVKFNPVTRRHFAEDSNLKESFPLSVFTVLSDTVFRQASSLLRSQCKFHIITDVPAAQLGRVSELPHCDLVTTPPPPPPRLSKSSFVHTHN